MEGLFAEEPILQGAQLGGPVKQGVVGRRQAPEQRLEESFQSKLLGLAAEKAGGFSQRLKWQSRKEGLHYYIVILLYNQDIISTLFLLLSLA